ncbi:MAG: HEPN domain-containing protein [Candidatus Eremiobacterota bacterium]
MQEFEWNGIWWIPGHKDKHIAGALKFNPVEGAILELTGSFYNSPGRKDFHDEDIIVGEIFGKIVTLYKCHECIFNINSPAFTSSTYSVAYIITNVHFDKKEDILFKSITVRTSYLEEWINLIGFRSAVIDREIKGQRFRALDVTYIHPPSEPVYKTEKFNITIKFNLSAPCQMTKKITLEQSNSLKLDFHELFTVEKIKEFISYIQNFLSLATGAIIYPVSIRGSKDETNGFDNVEIIYPVPLKKFDTSKQFLYNNMLFSFHDVSDNFGNYLCNWTDKMSDNIKPSYELYFAVRQVPMYQNFQFLSLMQAIEAYHRKTKDYEVIPRQKLKKIIKFFLKNMADEEIQEKFDINPEELKQKFRDNLNLSYQPTLKDRLEGIWHDYKFALELVFSEEGYKNFIKKVKNTRDYYTHYLETKKEIIEEKDLTLCIYLLLFILEICFLYETGMAEERIRKIIGRNENFKQLKVKVSQVFKTLQKD